MAKKHEKAAKRRKRQEKMQAKLMKMQAKMQKLQGKMQHLQDLLEDVFNEEYEEAGTLTEADRDRLNTLKEQLDAEAPKAYLKKGKTAKD